SEEHSAYMNWDYPEDKERIMKGVIPGGEKVIVLDEIHKYKEWRNTLKGLYDKNKSKTSFLVTGSARLDYYRRGGDSLVGRYYFYRLHPLSLYEIETSPSLSNLEQLLEFGGFPEMYLGKDKKEWKRWQKERISGVVKDDLLSLEQVKEVSQIELLAHMLISRIGSLLSINSLREDLKASHEAVSRWVSILENVYYCYRISPFGLEKIKAIKKDQKLYLWDWSPCENEGIRFENLVASNLLKFCHFHEDTQGVKMELRFIRDKEKREIDFVVIKDDEPLFAVECKSGDRNLSKHIPYFAKRTKIPVFYQTHKGESWNILSEHRAEIIPFTKLCAEVLKV
ncbi:MAG: ATP-binding protein, partial [Nitrospinae bacterium]|nr:ATP-binding protein [Nitrospinota bacterium]